MKRLLTTAGLVLALGLGLASAQNITKSLQGSQDPRGPVGQDTSNAMYFPGHINAFGQMTTAPTPSTCGSGTPTVLTAGSTDVAGIATPPSSLCTIVFGSPFNAVPACIITPATATSGQSFAVTPATTSFAMTALTSGTAYSYICIGNK